MCNAYCLKWDVPLNYTIEGKQLFLSDVRLPQLSWPMTLATQIIFNQELFASNHDLEDQSCAVSDWHDGACVKHNKANKLNENLSAC